MEKTEGKITVEDEYQIWYRRVGNDGVPLLILHGGPGAGHDYLEPLQDLAEDRTVAFYDQLGCGRSDIPDNRDLWHIDRFVTEIDTVRNALGFEKIHLLGHSWGGWLAIEYMLTKPSGIVSLVLASTSASTSQFVSETSRLKAELPSDVYETMQRCEAASDFGDPAYEEAVMLFYQRHLCRMPEWPDYVLRTVENLEGNAVYETMNGPNEFTVIGNLKDWDRTDRLGEISVPTLITVGRHDELTPACSETLKQGLQDSEMVIFEESSHLAHVEETERYLQVVGGFLSRVESQT